MRISNLKMVSLEVFEIKFLIIFLKINEGFNVKPIEFFFFLLFVFILLAADRRLPPRAPHETLRTFHLCAISATSRQSPILSLVRYSDICRGAELTTYEDARVGFFPPPCYFLCLS